MRLCASCGVMLTVRVFPSGKRESAGLFARRRHCSLSCGARRPMPTEKRCASCAETKPLGEFGRRRDGRPRGACRPCESRYQQTRDINRVRTIRRDAQHRARRDPLRRPKILAIQRRYGRHEPAPYLRLDPCSYCSGVGGEIDHIVPIASGGGDGWNNLTGACRHCNAAKSDMPMLMWLGRRLMAHAR